ncbi:MAG: 16S rRNA (cytidine(1402)-2'-O)-methyltransferase [Burkholderiales bacterium]
MHSKQSVPKDAALYVVATPIGNLGDMTLRAIEVLKQVDVIAAEDTRVTRNLLGHFGIRSELISLREHNERGATNQVLALLAEGKSVALVSDAGTPALSDPGALAVSSVRAAGFRVVSVPGANAAVTALSVSGLPAVPFSFHGFLPAKKSDREKALKKLQSQQGLQVFYEVPHRIVEAIESMTGLFGRERGVCIARELTKIFEQIHYCCLGEAVNWLRGDENRQRGEFVLIVEGATKGDDASDADIAGIETLRVLAILLRELPLKQAVQLASEITGARKNLLYDRALEMRKN